jgi:ferric-dicitrate binding protein FerR (iron transport regulator)
MTSNVGEGKASQALASLTELARTSVEPAKPARIRQGLNQITARLADDDGRAPKRRRWILAGALATSALAVLAIATIQHLRPVDPVAPTLGYKIEGGSVVDGGYLREAGSSGIKLRFSEGTQFSLEPGARGHLRSVDSAGARIAVEHGTATFQVTPRAGAKWLVDVGPFLVTVKGTVFSVSWDAAAGRFELKLRTGQVAVSGPVSGGDITLREGQRLVVNLSKAETLITEQDGWSDSPASPASRAAEVPQERPLPATERPAGRSSPAASAQPAASRGDGERRWAAAVAAGQWDRILADAERTGVKTTLDKASSEDLFALADAARYRRRSDLARSALLAERRRFPTSSRASDVAFLLGRIEESSEHGTARALEWYDDYLAHTPNGTYASEALGRKMILTKKLEGAGPARPLAEEYLRRFPGGTYAGSARALRPSP